MTDDTVAGEANGRNDDSVPADSGTQDDDNLDQILSEWDKEVEEKKQPSQTSKKSDEDDDELRQFVKEFRDREITKAFNETMETAVKTMREAAKDENDGFDLSDRAWRGILHDAANSDERVRSAFANRSRNPGAFTKLLKAIAREEAKAGKVSKSDTETRDQVNAAVRASTKRNPVNADDAEAEFRSKYLKASPAERQKMKQEIMQQRRFGG